MSLDKIKLTVVSTSCDDPCLFAPSTFRARERELESTETVEYRKEISTHYAPQCGLIIVVDGVTFTIKGYAEAYDKRVEYSGQQSESYYDQRKTYVSKWRKERDKFFSDRGWTKTIINDIT